MPPRAARELRILNNIFSPFPNEDFFHTGFYRMLKHHLLNQELDIFVYIRKLIPWRKIFLLVFLLLDFLVFDWLGLCFGWCLFLCLRLWFLCIFLFFVGCLFFWWGFSCFLLFFDGLFFLFFLLAVGLFVLVLWFFDLLILFVVCVSFCFAH